MTKRKLINKGGNSIDKLDIPTGGFPPIYLCDEYTKLEENDENKNREYSSHKSTVSIKDILSKRRNITPLINI